MRCPASRGPAAGAFHGSPVLAPDERPEKRLPRPHTWTYTEILWTYRYTMIAAMHTERRPFGEAPWLIPLLEKARTMLKVKELGGDKAYDANYIYEYAKKHDIDAQIKYRRTPLPAKTDHTNHYRKEHVRNALRDHKGFAAKANRRSNAEAGNHAFKSIMGDQLYSRTEEAQRCEVLCMAIAYNLTRLVYFELEKGEEVDFTGGLERVRTVPEGKPVPDASVGEEVDDSEPSAEGGTIG